MDKFDPKLFEEMLHHVEFIADGWNHGGECFEGVRSVTEKDIEIEVYERHQGTFSKSIPIEFFTMDPSKAYAAMREEINKQKKKKEAKRKELETKATKKKEIQERALFAKLKEKYEE